MYQTVAGQVCGIKTQSPKWLRSPNSAHNMDTQMYFGVKHIGPITRTCAVLCLGPSLQRCNGLLWRTGQYFKLVNMNRILALCASSAPILCLFVWRMFKKRHISCWYNWCFAGGCWIYFHVSVISGWGDIITTAAASSHATRVLPFWHWYCDQLMPT